MIRYTRKDYLIMSKRKLEQDGAGDKIKEVKKQNFGNKYWALGLVDSMNDPDLQVHSDDIVIVIKDKYPKAKFHYLILPKENISSLKKLTPDHIKLLDHIEKIANIVTKKDGHENVTFKFGYHAEASMHRLHMHVISDDMVSPCLKSKKHWNSFTTEFFLKPKFIRESLKENGKVKLPTPEICRKYMSTPLKCHKCSQAAKNMPLLKEHILTHMQ